MTEHLFLGLARMPSRQRLSTISMWMALDASSPSLAFLRGCLPRPWSHTVLLRPCVTPETDVTHLDLIRAWLPRRVPRSGADDRSR